MAVKPALTRCERNSLIINNHHLKISKPPKIKRDLLRKINPAGKPVKAIHKNICDSFVMSPANFTDAKNDNELHGIGWRQVYEDWRSNKRRRCHRDQ
jgi:hypothetical protein